MTATREGTDMTLATFDVKELKPLVEHAANAPRHTGVYGQENPGPGLFLVHDRGLYLMSNGEPHLPGDTTRNKVVYAEGMGPQFHMGGDDFAEFLELETFQQAIREGVEKLFITIAPTQLGVSWRAAERQGYQTKAHPHQPRGKR